MSRYQVTCLECKESDVHTMDDQAHQVTYSEKILRTPILGFRWRPDNKWGFHCRCGNYNLLAPQESVDFDKLVDGDDESLKRMFKSLSTPDETQFRMERV